MSHFPNEPGFDLGCLKARPMAPIDTLRKIPPLLVSSADFRMPMGALFPRLPENEERGCFNHAASYGAWAPGKISKDSNVQFRQRGSCIELIYSTNSSDLISTWKLQVFAYAQPLVLFGGGCPSHSCRIERREGERGQDIPTRSFQSCQRCNRA